jgi:PAS domain S-box-containing protein
MMSVQDLNIPPELHAPSAEFLEASEQLDLFWWFWNHRDRTIIISPGLLHMLHIDPDRFDHTIESVFKKIHPEDIAKNRERIKALIKGEAELYEMDFRVLDPDGGWKWFYNRGVVREWDDGGKPLVIGGITIDISGEYQHLLSMVEEKDKFEFIFRNSTEAVLIFNRKNGRIERIRDANQAAMDLFGLKQSDGRGSPSGHFSPDGMKRVEKVILEQLGGNGFARFEKKINMEGAGERWLEFTAHEFNLTGEDLVLTIISDKTSSRKTEAALRETERLYRILFEAADDRIGIFTSDGKPLLMNDAFYQSLGYTREEYLAMDDQESVHQEDKKRMCEDTRQLLQQGYSEHKYKARHKDGHYMHMSSKAVLISGDQGEEDLVLLIIRDISDREKFIEELETAKQAAEESDKLKSAFLANMSHEIRTPMNSIVGFSSLLISDGVDDRARKTYVDRIVRNSELLLALISDIVDLAKIESRQLSLIYGKLRISELLEELNQYTLEELERMKNKKLKVVVEQEAREVEMETDVIRITQVMKNLINNAVKFTDQGSITIGAKCDTRRNQVVFHVRDTGIGIDPEHFVVIFEQFRQLDGSDTRRFGGTGLGLAICKNLVQLMGGRIWVESNPGDGALFQVELPLKRPKKMKQDHPEPVETKPGSGVREGLFIMVVDDEPDSADLLEEFLSNMGHRVIKVPDGFEALKYLEQSSLPDVVMLDVEMPVLSGTDILRIIRERYGEISVVAQSAHALLGDRARFLNEGYDEYLPKPFTAKQLSDIIASLAPR